MLRVLKTLWEKNGQIIIYLLCSVIAALVESGIGWLLLQVLTFHIVVINTMAIITGAVIHYFLTSIFVFKVKKNVASVIVYVISFGFGILLQNAVIWLLYDVLLKSESQGIRYAVSKALSLAIPFFIVYYVRKKLNERFVRKESAKSA
ncbi:MAG: GtrA family protein [Clostridiales bacterium]|nr:GtrA family protein [Clostridiales bacterium]